MSKGECDFCGDWWTHHTLGSVHGKPMRFNKTASETDFKDCEIWMKDGEQPCLMAFDKCGSGAYIDINFCPICGRDLRNGA